MADEWGPLSALAGEWTGSGGVDTAFSHSQGKVLATPYLEKLTFKPFGPVENGSQKLFGLDYKTAMWRGSEDNPFHTEVGYWLWDADAGEIVRGFVVPRGITVLAGGFADADAKTFTLTASQGHPTYTIGENAYLAQKASTRDFTCTITTNDDGTFTYDETTTLQMVEMAEPFLHTDSNTVTRVV